MEILKGRLSQGISIIQTFPAVSSWKRRYVTHEGLMVGFCDAATRRLCGVASKTITRHGVFSKN